MAAKKQAIAAAVKTEPAAPAWPADAVERRSVASLVPYARNARTHAPEQISQIAASIREWGWTVPVLVDERSGIIAGHGRVLAAQQLGLADVPVMVARGWSEAQIRAYVLADNKLAINAAWDDGLLSVELGDLRDDGFDIDLIGFSGQELDGLFGLDDFDGAGSGAGNLADKFGIPPFSVLNAREGWWQDRKRAWLSLGIQSELGRGQERLEMAHPASTSTIDFYAQKRAIESEMGKSISSSAARAIMAERGTLTDDRADNAARMGRKANAIPGGQ